MRNETFETMDAIEAEQDARLAEAREIAHRVMAGADAEQDWREAGYDTALAAAYVLVGSDAEGKTREIAARLVADELELMAARSESAATLGRAGRGAAKVRGDSDHYRSLVSARASIEVTNDFHNTHVTLRPAADGWLSITQVRRARRILCPVTGCTCGASLGERGRQAWEYLDARNDGTVRVAARESSHE